MAWTQRDEEWWTTEMERIGDLSQHQEVLVEWLSQQAWTHLYHQTFRAEVHQGHIAVQLASRFLADVASSSMTRAALLVAERHPRRKERQLRHTPHVDPKTGEPEGRRGRLFHLHGLLATDYRSRSATSSACCSERASRRPTTHARCAVTSCQPRIPYWRLLKEAAWRCLGTARLYRLTVGQEIAATVYAVKYILKGMREWPESSPHPRSKLQWERPRSRDDWTLVTFPPHRASARLHETPRGRL